MKNHDLISILAAEQGFHKVVPFDENSGRLAALDLSGSNLAFTKDVYGHTDIFSAYINNLLKENQATYLIGGYREHRLMYSRSALFDKNLPGHDSNTDEPRCIHLGTDIWGPAGTKVFAALGGMVHSFAFNNNHGDYGATIILQHQLNTYNFYTLYGHLSVKDLSGLRKGQFISRGEAFAHFGKPEENGNWPPHLHFQLITDMGIYEGDYPGVCKLSEVQKYVSLSPDPDLLLRMNRFIR